jgi:hypothetical protein
MADTNASQQTATFLGVPVDTNHALVALGGAAAMMALGPAVLALPMVAGIVEATGVAVGPTGLAAIGGYLAAKHLANN